MNSQEIEYLNRFHDKFTQWEDMMHNLFNEVRALENRFSEHLTESKVTPIEWTEVRIRALEHKVSMLQDSHSALITDFICDSFRKKE